MESKTKPKQEQSNPNSNSNQQADQTSSFSLDRSNVVENWTHIVEGNENNALKELKQLGVSAYSTTALEENAFAQLNKMSDPKEQLILVQKQITKLQQELPNIDKNNTLTQEQKNQKKTQQMTLLQQLLDKQQKIQKEERKKRKREQESQQQAVDPLEQALNKAKENEQSQLIRMGKLTPFEAHGLRKQPTSLGINKNGQPAKIGVGSVRPVISHSTGKSIVPPTRDSELEDLDAQQEIAIRRAHSEAYRVEEKVPLTEPTPKKRKLNSESSDNSTTTTTTSKTNKNSANNNNKTNSKSKRKNSKSKMDEDALFDLDDDEISDDAIEILPDENKPKTYYDDGDDDLYVIRKSKVENDAELKKRARQKREQAKAKAKAKSQSTTTTTTTTTKSIKTEPQTPQTQVQTPQTQLTHAQTQPTQQTQTQQMDIDDPTQVPTSPSQILDQAEELIFENDELPNLQIFVENDENNNNNNNNNNNVGEGKNNETKKEIIEIEDDENDDDIDVQIEPGYMLPKKIYDNLYEYQRTCVKWLWQLHTSYVGGIIGDEMGLGKTVQSIAFLAGLLYSKQLNGPILIVCPATVMQQWVEEFHEWGNRFRVSLLHPSGTFKGARSELIKKMAKPPKDDWGSVLITTYEGVRLNAPQLLKQDWEYVLLDEGHKIRNPDAAITVTIKNFQTSHRIILTGAPIQNNLTELWSIFDFVYPTKLGTLAIFQTEFGTPITIGGYVNASSVQVHTAYKCALALKELISPYLLRRMKKDVLQLPNKNEHVLFCKLTDWQRQCYKEVLGSDDLKLILGGRKNLLFGIDILRKVCNHPDLLTLKLAEQPEDFGFWKRSGKLILLQKLLPLWKKEGHKVLLFSQTVQMLNVLEKFVKEEGFVFRRMDGMTPIKQRLSIVDEFNREKEIFIFLLSTRVGGLGLNLVGADRVLIFDPDWNPSTDVQARERAWRIGQQRDVTIFRFITSGTIEEKIYHRQIFKQFLTNKILNDPKQKRFLKFSHMKDLFSLGEEYEKPETEQLVDVNFEETEAIILEDQIRKASDESIKDEQNANENNNNNNNSSETQPTKLESGASDKDTFILKKLFDGQQIQSVISHDALLEKGGQEPSVVEMEAERVAKEALRAVKQSRLELTEAQQTLNNLSSKPTKGRFGKGSGAVSQSIITDLKQTQKGAQPGMSSSFSIVEQQTQPKLLVELLVNFLREQKNKSASTSEIIAKFKKEVPQNQNVLFRTILRSVATLENTTWILKKDFQ